MIQILNVNKWLIKKKGYFVLSILLLFLAALAFADLDNTVADPNELQVTIEIEPEEQIKPVADGETATLTFQKNTNIRDALRILGAKYQRNIVPSPAVDGTLAFTSLYDVTFDEAMTSILGNNLKHHQEGNLLKVYTADEYRKIMSDTERMTWKVFTLYYIGSGEAIKLVTPVLSGAGLVQASTAAEAGIHAGEGGVREVMGGDSMALNDYLVIYDYPENIERAGEIIANIDIRPQQVLVEATIMAATLTEDTRFGIDWSSIGGRNVQLGSGGVAVTGLSPSLTEIGGFAAGITSQNFTALITAHEGVSDITVLATPQILALNKQIGTVFIGQKEGYRDRSTISAAGGDAATIGEVSFLETGTKLSFRPYIGRDGFIRMDIYPKDSSGDIRKVGDDYLPFERTAEVGTNIMVKDGESVVIGGLFREGVVTSKTKVPILGDLPIIGLAFRGSSDETKRQEVIIMLTPHIVQDSRDTNPNTSADDISRKRHGAKEGMQDISQAKIAEDKYAQAAALYVEGQYADALTELDVALLLRPTYLEALRLKDRILKQLGEFDESERVITETVRHQDEAMWNRN